MSKLFRTGTVAVSAVTDAALTVAAGERLAVVGPSGAGKSTLLAMIGTLERPSSGEVLIQGQSVTRLRDRAVARVRGSKIGFIFQTFNLMERRTAIENVMEGLRYSDFPLSTHGGMAESALLRVGLSERRHHYPAQLSGGERQRVGVARALAKRPTLILADEPTGNLDSLSAERVMDLLLGIDRSLSTVVLVTHNEQAAASMDRRVVVQDGRLHHWPAQ